MFGGSDCDFIWELSKLLFFFGVFFGIVAYIAYSRWAKARSGQGMKARAKRADDLRNKKGIPLYIYILLIISIICFLCSFYLLFNKC